MVTPTLPPPPNEILWDGCVETMFSRQRRLAYEDLIDRLRDLRGDDRHAEILSYEFEWGKVRRDGYLSDCFQRFCAWFRTFMSEGDE